jgi:glutamate-ammonia-ligase adenylyltransferase
VTVDQELQSDLGKVAGQSPYFEAYLATSAGQELTKSGYLEQSEFAAEELKAALLPLQTLDSSVADFDERLRQWRHWEMARIIFRDQSRRADMVATTRDLTLLADTCIAEAHSFHFRQLSASLGEPQVDGSPQGLCVLALGKQGAFELNLSSDIDLIFFYESSGALPSGRSYQEFYLKLARNLINSLDKVGPMGFVFRVDMRLRPYGESGALVLHRTAMEKYYLEQGRDWERYAFIKARTVAGDIAGGEDFLQWMRPFVYRKHIDYGALESLRDMKSLINQEVSRKSLQEDVKLGPGGIREIEFIVQSQQLIWGGKKPELQLRRLLDALDVLKAEALLPASDIEMLRSAYIFLRNTEHVIQAENDRQTQALPIDDVSRARLAAAMGFESYEDFYTALSHHRTLVAEVFADLMAANEAEKESLLEGNLIWSRIWQAPESEQAAENIQRAGFAQVEQVVKQLIDLKRSSEDLDGPVLERLAGLVPLVLRLCSREVEPEQTLVRILTLTSQILRRSTYIVFLNENLDVLQRVVRLCAMSEYVASQLARYPILLYELSEAELDRAVSDSDDLACQLDEELTLLPRDDLEGRMDVLRTFKHAANLKVAAYELLGELPTMRASDQLTKIAELSLQRAVDLASDYLTARHGQPTAEDGSEIPVDFGIVAYGKLGGFELGYGSDLDLVFVHGVIGNGETSGARPIYNRVFYQRLGQRVVHILTTLTRFGKLFEVDLRLRPDGSSGPLVITMPAFARYLDENAWTWEQQAIVRARLVVGSGVLAEAFQALRTRVIERPREPRKLAEEVQQMRAKMRANLKPRAAEQIDLKQERGALIDIEFLVQFQVLRYGAENPELARWTDNVRILATLAASGLLLDAEAELLSRAFVAYRSMLHLDWLGGDAAEKSQLAELLEEVSAVWDKYLGPV